jgi:hypothetical protein
MKNLSVLVLFLLFSITALITSCNNSSQTQEAQNNIDSSAIDSSQIVKVLRETYTWANVADTTQPYDFTLAYPDGGFCTGIDQEANNKRMSQLQATGFFDEAFFDNYKRILKKIDTEIKADTAKYKEGDGLEVSYMEASPWCNCQDYPDKYWENLTIKDLTFNGNEASAKWFWIWGENKEEYSYNIKLKKVNNTWKISHLEGFDNM